MMSLNNSQIEFIIAVVGFFGFIYGQKFYKDYRKKQAQRDHWRNKRTKR